MCECVLLIVPSPTSLKQGQPSGVWCVCKGCVRVYAHDMRNEHAIEFSSLVSKVGLAITIYVYTMHIWCFWQGHH